MVLEPGLAHMSRQHMPACTSSAITGSIDTASCLLSMPVSIRQRTLDSHQWPHRHSLLPVEHARADAIVNEP